MLKTTPQKCLNDFLSGHYIKRNYKFLIPVYEKLFKDMGKEIDITSDFKKEIESLIGYFSYVEILKNKNNVSLNNKGSNKKEIIDGFVRLISKKKINKAVATLEKIVNFLCENRTNINGLEIISWSLFGETTLKDIENTYINDVKKRENIKNALLGFEFMSLLIEYKGFSNVIINDLLIPVELINPKRRQGLFDKEVFKLIATEIKKDIKNFQFETKIEKRNDDFFKNNTNWLITEKTTKRIKFPLPKNAKKIDMLCKFGNFLFIGTHKEQKANGGGQDNQAVDASFLFNYKTSELEKIKKIFNIKKIYLCIFLERGREKITSSYWKKIFKTIKEKSNNNKYLLSSAQFIDLLKAEI